MYLYLRGHNSSWNALWAAVETATIYIQSIQLVWLESSIYMPLCSWAKKKKHVPVNAAMFRNLWYLQYEYLWGIFYSILISSGNLFAAHVLSSLGEMALSGKNNKKKHLLAAKPTIFTAFLKPCCNFFGVVVWSSSEKLDGSALINQFDRWHNLSPPQLSLLMHDAIKCLAAITGRAPTHTHTHTCAQEPCQVTLIR